MAELLLALTCGGAVLSSRRELGRGNPFQIYFLVWFLIFLAYYLTRKTFVAVSADVLAGFVCATVLALCALLTILLRADHARRDALAGRPSIAIDDRVLLLGQVLAALLLPLVYQRALSLAGGESLFSVAGYMQLRGAMINDGENYGILAYASVFSSVVASVSAAAYAQDQKQALRFLLSVAVGLAYAFLNTGRTSILLIFCLTLAPLALIGALRLRGLLFFLSLFCALFVLSASLTAKGIAVDDALAANVDSFLTNLRSYTVAPLVALSEVVAEQRGYEYGGYSLRFLHSLLYRLDLTSHAPVALVRDFAYVPDPTNVYTVYEVYFRDFSYFGFLIPPAFLLGHFWLYRRAAQRGGLWLFYYAASLYPLVMQFFQDQYFSLLSQWFQAGFWYWLLLKPARTNAWRTGKAR